jgi:hypothetical protein
MKRALGPLLLLPVLAGCSSTPLPCRLEAIALSGDVVDEEGELISPQAGIVDLTHSPDGCLTTADIRVVGPGGEDCELRAVASGVPGGEGLAVTQFTLSSTGDCGWPASVNGASSGTGDSYVALDGSVDVAGGDGDNACVLGTVRLVVGTTLAGNSSESLAGTYWFNDGLTSVLDRTGSCPPVGDDDDSAR